MPAARVAAVSGRAAGQPPGDGAEVVLVFRAELPPERRFLVPTHERPDGRAEHGSVRDERPAAEHRRLSEDDGGDGEVHRVPDVAVQPAYDELPGRRNRRRRADPFEREASERLENHGRSGSDRDCTEDPEPEWWVRRSPPGQEPGHEPGDDAGSDDEKQQAAGGCMEASDPPILGAYEHDAV